MNIGQNKPAASSNRFFTLAQQFAASATSSSLPLVLTPGGTSIFIYHNIIGQQLHIPIDEDFILGHSWNIVTTILLTAIHCLGCTRAKHLWQHLVSTIADSSHQHNNQTTSFDILGLQVTTHITHILAPNTKKKQQHPIRTGTTHTLYGHGQDPSHNPTRLRLRRHHPQPHFIHSLDLTLGLR